MLEPKEQAKLLVENYKFGTSQHMEHKTCKECALIHVNGLIESARFCGDKCTSGFHHRYWLKVKQEIEKL